MDKTCHPGMGQHFYLRHSPGVGSYNGVKPGMISSQKTSLRYSLPRSTRGLTEDRSPLQLQKATPAPTAYNLPRNHVTTKMKTAPRFKMPQAGRDVHFSKYNSQFAELISKSLH